MELQHIAFKVFVEGDLTVDWEQFINVFHTWVAAQSMPEMMIDVADYRHVPNGPGVVMTGHEADYYMDNTGGEPGLRYVSKVKVCLLYTSPSPRDATLSRMPSSA